jgi:hypothetical protein
MRNFLRLHGITLSVASEATVIASTRVFWRVDGQFKFKNSGTPHLF